MKTAGVILAALGAMFGPAASAQGQAQVPAPAAFKVISPIFGQLVTFSMPMSFVAVAENVNGPNYIREAVLKGETATRWTQMITVTGAKGMAANSKDSPKASPEAFAGSIVGGFKSACPDSFVAKAFGPARFGDQGAFVAVTSCGSIGAGADRHSETALVVAVKGSADYYTLQWAERSPATTRPAIDEARWQERLRQLQPIRFCPIVAGEKAPYPSCANKD